MEYKNSIKGVVKLFFQPAEELADGAKMAIQEGILKNPNVTKVFGIHMWSDVDFNKIAITSGELMASGGQFKIVILV